jgi:hypothetical protein
MNLKKYSLLFTALVLAVVAVVAIIVYTPPDEGDSGETLNLLFPTGIPAAFGTTSATSLGEQNFNTISVTGSGTASVQADEATVTLGVQTEDESASEAVGLNAELMTDVINAIKLLGITEDDMKTVSYSVYPMYGKDNYNTVVGYRVVNMVAVKITEMELIGEVIDDAAESGANRIQGLSFGLSEESQEELRRQAYLSALSSAEEKAELIAEKLDLTITGVLYVSESSYQPYQSYRDYVEVLGTVEPTTPIIEGKLSVSVTVHVVYSFEG